MRVRDHLIEALRAELVGPYDYAAPAAEEILPFAPSRRYLTGFLAPPEFKLENERAVSSAEPTSETDALEGEDEFAAGSDKESDDSATPDPEPAMRKVFPASVGMSVLLPKEAEEVTVRVRWGQYHRDVLLDGNGSVIRAGEEKRGKVKPHPGWRRAQVGWLETRVRLDARRLTAGIAIADGVFLQGRVADAGKGDGMQALALFVVNRKPIESGASRDEALLFQVGYELHCEAGILARPDLTGEDGSELDDRINDLQYRDRYEYVVGHGVAAQPIAGSQRDGRVTGVEICWVPQAEFKPVAARGLGSLVEVSMKKLGGLRDADGVRAALGELPGAYEAWIAQELTGRAELSAKRSETLAHLAERARTASERIRGGIELLANDREVLQAFVYANLAMYAQARERGLRSGESWAEDPKWRLFQLAFVLMCLDDVANPQGHGEGKPSYRDDVELIFFPTGGGKTEAYLGLIAFTLVLRRLRGRKQGHGGEGIAVMLRYTLRLLTLDQLERASTLICALEDMRARWENKLGTRRFEIGLWVGGKASANTMAQFKDQLTAYRADTGGNPCPLQNCPWCGTGLTSKSLTIESTSSGLERVVVRCHAPECKFSQAPHGERGLPIQFVDEQIYRELPCFLVATVDKFAMLPWRGDTGLLFGRATHRDEFAYYGPATGSGNIPKVAKPIAGLLPPELIVQDELHLISGPLGTMVGLFETAIEELCTRELEDGSRIRPKLIAATATVRRAQRQVQALYGRSETNLFPPQGIDPFETWFSRVDHDSPGRVYVGVAATGRAMKRVLLRTYLAVLGGAAWATRQGGATAEEVDGYLTLAGYFNSLRELGGMRRLVEDDIATRAKQQESTLPLDKQGPYRWVANRTIGLPDELTSRESTAKIAKIKDKAARAHVKGKGLDVLLASNMISVGVDISRLGVMVVAGQPKTTAEYIQASSRVGRAAKWPGLVVTAYNIYRPRDRSHYEHFAAYHESFYRHVEATSVTPFSAPAIDRGLAALVVALARLLDVQMTASGDAMKADRLQALAGRILAVIRAKAANQPRVGAAGEAVGDVFANTVSDRAESLVNAWLSIIEDRKKKLASLNYSPFDPVRDKGRPLLRTVLEMQVADPETQQMLSPEERRFAAPTSMRDVEPSVHVWRRYKLGARD